MVDDNPSMEDREMALGSSVQTVQQKNGKQMNDTEKGCVPLFSLSLSLSLYLAFLGI